MNTAFQLMAKPTGSICNIDCKYCFYLEKPHLNQRRMDDDILESYIKNYIQLAPQKELTFLWQGGEPTLAGLDFYQQAVELQRKYANGKRIYNALQTNGLLLDEKWCRFLKAEQFLVGVSIDGPQHLHDAYRVTKSQKGTFSQVMQAIENLLAHQVQFNTLTVVHKANVRHGKEIYQFLKSIGSTYMQFIPLMGNFEQEAAAKDYGKMMIEIFDEWRQEDIGRIGVQFIEQWLMAYLGFQPSLCIFRKTCGDQMIIEQNGDIYSCDHYVYPEYKIGNLIETPLLDITYSAKQQQFGINKAKVSDRCQQCRFRFACNGGCPKHRKVQGFGEPHNVLCEAYYSALSHMEPFLKQFAWQLKQRKL
ncbi:MAG: anaerobic sulfatase maturase [Pasteurellaceae bacterium]|nr:anaerobic sulfatase maturase [Pasteurellaceae bacterium]